MSIVLVGVGNSLIAAMYMGNGRILSSVMANPASEPGSCVPPPSKWCNEGSEVSIFFSSRRQWLSSTFSLVPVSQGEWGLLLRFLSYRIHLVEISLQYVEDSRHVFWSQPSGGAMLRAHHMELFLSPLRRSWWTWSCQCNAIGAAVWHALGIIYMHFSIRGPIMVGNGVWGHVQYWKSMTYMCLTAILSFFHLP